MSQLLYYQTTQFRQCGQSNTSSSQLPSIMASSPPPSTQGGHHHPSNIPRHLRKPGHQETIDFGINFTLGHIAASTMLLACHPSDNSNWHAGITVAHVPTLEIVETKVWHCYAGENQRNGENGNESAPRTMCNEASVEEGWWWWRALLHLFKTRRTCCCTFGWGCRLHL